MRLSFRPFWGLTLTTIIALGILISLGTWQYHRLQWKTALLAEVESAVTAPPLTSLSAASDLIDTGEPVDFRRIAFEAEPAQGDTYYVYTPEGGGVGWRVFQPVTNAGVTVFAAVQVITDAEKEQGVDIASLSGPIAGYVRKVRPGGRIWADSSPEQNEWFGFNPKPETHNWRDSVVGGADTRFYIDGVAGVSAAENLPVKRPDIRNNHFDYMLTWYGLALVLIVIYAVIHIREGRLSWR